MIKPQSLFMVSIMVLFIWPSYIAYKFGPLPGLSLDRFFILFLFITFFLYLVFSAGAKRNLQKYSNMILLFILYTIWNLFSSIFAAEETMKSIFSSINWFLSGPFLALYMFMFFNKEKNISKLINTLVATMIVINLLGILEVFKEAPLFTNYLITVNENTLGGALAKSRDSMYRVQSVFSNPLVYAQYLIGMLPLFFYMLKIKKSKMTKLFYIMNIAVFYFVLYHTNSRAGLGLSVLFPFIVYFIRSYKKHWFPYVTTIFKYIGLPILLFFASNYLHNTLDDVANLHQLYMSREIDQQTVSSLVRILQIKTGITSLINEPIIGFGHGEAMRAVIPLKSIDNYYLTLLLSTGIIGIFIFIFFLYFVIRRGIRNVRYYHDEPSIYLLSSFVLLSLFYLILSIDKGNNLLFIIAALIFIRAKMLAANTKENDDLLRIHHTA